MANQNLFEKYGIRDVADVTLYRIEKKEETFESQRKIAASSILKGALELRTVYPILMVSVMRKALMLSYLQKQLLIRVQTMTAMMQLSLILKLRLFIKRVRLVSQMIMKFLRMVL